MVNNNKVLTVSYGTFSCTLEGFEDSFDTMKAIAEYFRDLASDDRYFGAEPPQPDADMLARIAQREITRKVEARHDESGIVLRASDGVSSESAPVASAPVAAAAAALVAPVTQATAEPAIDTVPVEETAGSVDAVADEPVVAEDVIDDLTPADVALEDAIQDVAADPIIESGMEDAEEALDVVAEETAAADEAAAVETAVSEPEVEIETIADAGIVEAPAEAEPASDVQPSVDSIAAKLQRIRAVVARNETLADDEEFTEDLQSEAFVASAAADINDVLDVEDKAHDDDAEEDDAIGAILGQLDIADDVSEGTGDDATEVPDAEVTQAVEAEDAEVENAEAEIATAEVDQVESAEAEVAEDTSLFEGLEMAPEAAPVAVADQDEAEVASILDAVSEPDTSVEEPKPARKIRRVRVKAIKRSDLEQAIASGAIETVADPEATPVAETPEAPVEHPSSLTAEAEADLMRELAEVEAEFSAPTDPSDPVAEAGPDVDLDDEADDDIDFDIFEDGDVDTDDAFEDDDDDHSTSNLLAETDQDEDLTRLMAAAEEKLDDPEIASKAEAFQNLRAAVAATQADRETGGEPDAATKDNEYRADLAQVVKPRRPSASSTASPRPRTEVSKPAPLKLVAEQRVDDIAEVKAASPVRPRRIATPLETAESIESDTEFSAFIEEMDVHSLAELLEATASYMSFAEGREQFSRPQLMSKVRLVHDDGFNREDGLRAFGQLLREGKIEKAGGGRFAASGDIGYQPQSRAAG